MVTYDNTKCTKCGQCLITCHEHCIFLSDEGIGINYESCSTCTHCIAVCPEQAIGWNNIPSQKINTDILPTSRQIKEFLKSRRSDFHFEDREIEREILKDIAVMGKYSPTNNYDMDVIIVDNPDIINSLERLCARKVKFLDYLFFRFKPMTMITKWFDPAFKKDEAKIKAARGKKGKTFSGATALIIVIGDRKIMYTELSAQYFLYNMQLYAKTLGLGSRPSGGGKWFLAKSKSARRILDIPKNKTIQAILFLGYPSLQYVNKAEGIAPKMYFK